MASGIAFTLAIPHMTVVHDRRPPGLDRAVGAPGANAGLLHGSDGWRAVVLPSLGDVAQGLGAGPVAIRADGRRIAAAVDGGVEEWDLGSPDPVARHEGHPAALCYAADGALVAAAGAAVVAPGGAPAPGSPIASLSAAAAAERLVAGHEDGTVSVWAGRRRRSRSPPGRRPCRAPAHLPCRRTVRWSPSAPPPARHRRPASCAPRTARWRAASRAPGSSPPRRQATG